MTKPSDESPVAGTANGMFASKSLSLEELFLRLQSGHLLITGNSRLTRVVAGKYNQWRIEKGDQQWRSPRLMSWAQWLDECWETVGLQGVEGFDKAVPNQRQLTSLWENAIQNGSVSHNLLHPESLASQLRDTRKLIREWCINPGDQAWFGDDNENHSAFHMWNKAFESTCQQGNWIAPEDRAPLLGRAVEAGKLPFDAPLDFLGFDEFNPQQLELLDAIQVQGAQLCALTITARSGQAGLWKGTDSNSELQTMARWVRHQFETNPEDSIAVVVPDLQSRRQEVERHLLEILAPGETGVSSNPPWNISMGTPLARIPMIETAFDLFKLLDDRFEITDVSRILSSPWIRGATQERNSRALLEKCLRDKHPRQITLSDVRYRSGEIKDKDRYGNPLPENQHAPQSWNCPGFSNILQQMQKFSRAHQAKLPASSWAEVFDRLLSATGWPFSKPEPNGNGQAAETTASKTGDLADHQSSDWQTLQAWRDALGELASLDATDSLFNRHAAIGQLKQICREMIFQPQSSDANIQVLGLYEVNGLRFDHLWVVGLYNDSWPASAKPNPFIPGRLQRDAGMPNSSPQRELDVARVITRRLFRTADNIIFSYPGKVDGEDVSASPLLNAATAIDDEALQVWQGQRWVDAVATGEPPSVDPLMMPGKMVYGTARGGSSILKNQALCPFRAFASNRLGAEGLEIPADGISPSLHGGLLHQVLEYFWIETISHAALVALSPDELATRVRRHVDAVVADEYGLKQRPAFCQVEADRIQRLVMDYLELEKTREPFEVIGFEQEFLPVIDGQEIRLIVDRIDQMEDGEKVIIDYKTGKVDPKKWFSQRPEDPQMPLYAITTQEAPAALAFAVIRDEKCEYKGIASATGLLPGLPVNDIKTNHDLVTAGNDMQLTIDNWRATLHRLMSEFIAGEAKIDPKSGINTCKQTYCQLQSLCRVGELVQRQQSDTTDNQQQVAK